MIDSGVPGSPEEWPNGVLQRLRAFSQGDVIRTPPLFYFADPRRAIWSETQRYLADSDGPEVVLAEELSPPYGLITSQTCDIAEEDSPRPLKPWVQVAPIFALRGNSGYKKHLRKGAGPAIYIYLPNLPGEEFWVADLRIEVPVEKGWLAYQERLDGFGSEEAQSIVGQRVGWLRERPAFSGAFVRSVQRTLIGLAVDLRSNDGELSDLVEGEVEEIGVRADSLLNPTSVQLVFITGTSWSEATRSWLGSVYDQIAASAAENQIVVLPFGYATFETMSAASYRSLTIMLRGGIAGP